MCSIVKKINLGLLVFPVLLLVGSCTSGGYVVESPESSPAPSSQGYVEEDEFIVAEEVVTMPFVEEVTEELVLPTLTVAKWHAGLNDPFEAVRREFAFFEACLQQIEKAKRVPANGDELSFWQKEAVRQLVANPTMGEMLPVRYGTTLTTQYGLQFERNSLPPLARTKSLLALFSMELEEIVTAPEAYEPVASDSITLDQFRSMATYAPAAPAGLTKAWEKELYGLCGSALFAYWKAEQARRNAQSTSKTEGLASCVDDEKVSDELLVQAPAQKNSAVVVAEPLQGGTAPLAGPYWLRKENYAAYGRQVEVIERIGAPNPAKILVLFSTSDHNGAVANTLSVTGGSSKAHGVPALEGVMLQAELARFGEGVRFMPLGTSQDYAAACSYLQQAGEQSMLMLAGHGLRCMVNFSNDFELNPLTVNGFASDLLFTGGVTENTNVVMNACATGKGKAPIAQRLSAAFAENGVEGVRVAAPIENHTVVAFKSNELRDPKPYFMLDKGTYPARTFVDGRAEQGRLATELAPELRVVPLEPGDAWEIVGAAADSQKHLEQYMPSVYRSMYPASIAGVHNGEKTQLPGGSFVCRSLIAYKENKGSSNDHFNRFGLLPAANFAVKYGETIVGNIWAHSKAGYKPGSCELSYCSFVTEERRPKGLMTQAVGKVVEQLFSDDYAMATGIKIEHVNIVAEKDNLASQKIPMRLAGSDASRGGASIPFKQLDLTAKQPLLSYDKWPYTSLPKENACAFTVGRAAYVRAQQELQSKMRTVSIL